MVFPNPYRASLISFLKDLQNKIILEFESFEQGLKFQKTSWKYQGEGGGEMAVLRGNHFEKAAVNWSGVGGSSFPLDTSTGEFFATGVSLITHMSNPHAPTAHMNIRFIETQNRCWFGGGYDLSPMGFPYEEDTRHFHEVAKNTLDAFDVTLYKQFSENAKKYFYIPHRQKERGVGGIFFDYYNTDNFEEDVKMWESVGLSFIEAILPIYKKRLIQPYFEEERELQLKCRAHYAEFNLIYDRGTKFGFQSGGNPDAILCSMPPLAKW
jgi:coproporphyrinogen III oxidase